MWTWKDNKTHTLVCVAVMMLTHLESMFREIMPLAHILYFSFFVFFTSYNTHIYNAINLSAYINRIVYFSCYIFLREDFFFTNIYEAFTIVSERGKMKDGIFFKIPTSIYFIVIFLLRYRIIFTFSYNS